MGDILVIINILALEINADKRINMLFLTENHLYESYRLILID